MNTISPGTIGNPLASPENIASNINSNNNSSGNITSPQLIAKKARRMSEWKDLIYREALTMSGALRQIQSHNNNSNNARSQLVNIFHALFGFYFHYFYDSMLFRPKSYWVNLMGYLGN